MIRPSLQPLFRRFRCIMAVIFYIGIHEYCGPVNRMTLKRMQ